MKKKAILHIISLTLCVLLLSACSSEPESELVLDGDNTVVVRINGRALTREEMHRELLNLIMTVGYDLKPDELVQRRNDFELQAIQNLINTELLVTEANRRGVHIPETKIQEQIGLLQKAYVNAEFYQKELKIRKLTPDELEQEAARALLVESVINQVLAAVSTPEPETISNYYESNKEMLYVPEQVHASHILILVAADDSEQVKQDKRAEMERLRMEAIGGTSFSELAKKHSQCPSAERGGDLGWFSRDRMDPTISKVAFDLESGSISDVVETSFGYHIVQKHAIKPRHMPQLDEIRPDLVKHLHDHSRKMAIQGYIQELRRQADIQIVPTEGM